ncbi:MAG: flavin-dependent oxidoreductase, F420-dependent methylene-tetrahydromethanopterin reductase [Actinomycetia bacterium]|nr:flavin-dependent oxidoreductase, F420-dependent methylene-tetrahydromethanopterin reductase [Actinomycetes bacterium]
MRISCGLVPSLDVVEHAKLAEELGYQRAWLYDSPAIYLDIWASLALVATQTERIGLGTAVLVPSLRNVVATASAIATIEAVAPGRLACAFGTGATARWTLGKRALSLATVGQHLRQLRGLLAGEVVEVDGLACQMTQLPRFAPARPIAVPLLLSALGPKGQELTREVADGIMTVGFDAPGFDWSARLVVGTVLDQGEALTSERVKQSAGPWYAIMGHGAWEAVPEAVDGFPGGAEWRAKLESMRPEGERHLAVHEGHATTVTELDRILVDAAGEGIVGMGWVAEADAMAAKIADAEVAGTTEIIYAPSGPDIARELRAFAAAAKIS